MVASMGKMRGNVSPSPMSTILITESQRWYVCVGLHLLSSQLSFLLPCIVQIQMLYWLQILLNMYVFFVLILVIVAGTTSKLV